MGDLKEEIIAKTMGITQKPEQTIDEVKKQAEDMNVIDHAMETAKKLAGTGPLSAELQRKDERMEKLEKEKDKKAEELHESQIQNVKTELGGKIDHLAESIKGGASPKSLGNQIADIKTAASELGLGGSKISEIKEIMGFISSMNPKTNLAEQVKEAKDLISTLQPSEDKGKGPTVEGVPAEIAVQLKEMDHNLQISLAKMDDERQIRAQEFQLTLRKYDEERLSRQEKMQMDYSIQKERNEIISGGLQMMGKAAGKAYAEVLAKSPEGSAAPIGGQATNAQKSFRIELNEGETGTMECPHCKGAVGVGPETEVAECIGCHTKFPVTRTASATQPEEEE